MFFQDMISLDILYIKECADKRLGIKNIDLEVHMFGGQTDGILNGMKDMPGVVIGRIGIFVINLTYGTKNCYTKRIRKT
jgi:hypothetical protein